ncbi:probable G-protein coupled receptor B0563.6 [Mytilus trossulus]|uniref:probable G-protein coupled receptor B0563.6 n=1 Tax=Mytilus trossulus TaxID=6551 RepID=UPI003006B8BC
MENKMENSSLYILHSSDSYGHLDERSMFNSSISTQNTTNLTAGFRTEISFHDVIISKDTLQTMKLVFGIILLFPVSALGIFGNAISLIVLCQQKGKKATNYCLMALAISDLLLLVNAFFFSVLNIYIYNSPIEGTNFKNSLFPTYGIYFTLVTARITSLMTTLLSVERFVAVHFPMKAKFICNKKTTLVAIIVIYLITIVLFLPFPFKYNIVYRVKNNISYTLVVRNRSLSDNFCALYGLAMNIIFRFTPIILILLLNFKIMNIVWKTRRIRESISLQNEGQSQEQRKITIMLLVVTFTFIICILPGAINSLLQLAWKGYSRLGKSRNFQQLLSYITFLLEATNSALNFVIYMALSARFYAKYKEIFFSAKDFIRQVSVNSFSRGKSSFAIHKKCDSQSSFTYSEDPANQRLANKMTNCRNDSYKSLLQHSGNGQCSKGRNSTKINQPPNGTLYELSEKSKTSSKAADSSPSRKYFILDQSESDSDNIKLPPLVKQDTLETNVDP